MGWLEGMTRSHGGGTRLKSMSTIYASRALMRGRAAPARGALVTSQGREDSEQVRWVLQSSSPNLGNPTKRKRPTLPVPHTPANKGKLHRCPTDSTVHTTTFQF